MAKFCSLSRFVLLPGIAGLMCYGCSKTVAPDLLPISIDKGLEDNRSENKSSQPGSVAITADSSRELLDNQMPNTAAVISPPKQPPNDTITPPTTLSKSTAAYREGINLASSAYRLSQSAASPDDWGLIASRWQQAARQLQDVHQEDVNYTRAQQKITEYVRHAEQATARMTALQQAAYHSPPSNSSASSSPPRPAQSVPAATVASPVVVPVVRRLHGTPVVRVTFNGEKSYDMILDTGASRTLITRTMASELGVVSTESIVATTASEAEVIFDIGLIRSISMGGITLQAAKVSIGESVNIGLLGNDFLRGYDVTIRENVVELSAAD
ncbi:MAG: hypothetical protein HC800_19875 [Phormidesmis sp. RL_2_1]|nr:hypothetical protein [Phormidesmis sp. RL_2_1]